MKSPDNGNSIYLFKPLKVIQTKEFWKLWFKDTKIVFDEINCEVRVID